MHLNTLPQILLKWLPQGSPAPFSSMQFMLEYKRPH